MKRKKEHSRVTYVAGDSRKRRLHQLFKVCAVLLLPTLYLFYSLSGLYLMDVEISKLKEQIVWCLLHPLKVYNDKKPQYGSGGSFAVDDLQFSGVQ